jgi:hypothetical protein
VHLTRLILGVAILTLVAGCAPRGQRVSAPPTADPTATPEAQGSPTPPPTAPPLRPPSLVVPANAAALKVPGATFSAWAFMDRRTGKVSGSANFATARNTVESMIKPWLAADYLRRQTESKKQPTQKALNELTLMIIDSNDPVAEKYYQIGGGDNILNRLFSICKLSNVEIEPGKWSFTEMSAKDAIGFGLCLADGRAAGPTWTNWLLDTMRHVRGTVNDQVSGAVQGGRWGIIDALPPEVAAETSIKNGFTSYVDGWHVNCLAIHQDWIIVIMMHRYGSLSGAAQACTALAKAFVVTSG